MTHQNIGMMKRKEIWFMKKRFFGVMLAASLAVSLTACGGKKTSQDSAASTVNKEVTAEEYAGTITSNADVYKQYVTLPDYKRRSVFLYQL